MDTSKSEYDWNNDQINTFYSLFLLQEIQARPFVTTFWERNLPSVGGLLKFMGVSTVVSAVAAAGLLVFKKGLLPHRS